MFIMNYKKIISALLALMLVCSAFVACGNDSNTVDTDGTVSDTPVASSSNESVSSVPTTSSVSSESTSSKQEYSPTLLSTLSGKGSLLQFNDNIYKVELPLNGSYTTVFFIKLDNGYWDIIDTGSHATDVNTLVLPSAEFLKIDLEKVKGIILTHTHYDHAGGLAALAPKCPNAVVYGVASNNADAGSNKYKQIADGETIDDVIKTVTIKGHDYDTCGFIDTRSKTLMSGDSLQLYGSSFMGTQVRHINDYFESMDKLLTMDIENIIGSHIVCPSGAYAIGETASRKYIQDCIDCLSSLVQLTIAQYGNGITDVATIQRLYLAEMYGKAPDFPTGGFDTAINAIINEYCK